MRSRRFGGRARRQQFPAAARHGLRLPPASIDTAASAPTSRASVTGSASNRADAKSYTGTYDLICFFDCLHDMGDPVGISAVRR